MPTAVLPALMAPCQRMIGAVSSAMLVRSELIQFNSLGVSPPFIHSFLSCCVLQLTSASVSRYIPTSFTLLLKCGKSSIRGKFLLRPVFILSTQLLTTRLLHDLEAKCVPSPKSRKH